jgi:hypothetical protein
MTETTPTPTVIEVGGQAVAVAVPESGRFRFVAVKYPVWSLDDRLFQSTEEARRAAHDLLRPRARPTKHDETRPEMLVA